MVVKMIDVDLQMVIETALMVSEEEYKTRKQQIIDAIRHLDRR